MSDIQQRFESLQNSTAALRNSTAAQRAEKIKAIWQGIVERKEDLFKAGEEERGCHEVDIAAELVMIKSEVDFAVKNLAKSSY